MKRVYWPILLLAAAACTTSVDSTEHCTLTRYGTITERKMSTGLHFTPISTATCFSMVDHNFPTNKEGKEVIAAQTADPITIDADLSVIYSYDPATIDSVFLEKRSAEQAEIEVLNAVRAGYRNAIAGWTVAQIFSNRRPALDDSVRVAIQRKIGRKAIIKQVFLREIRAPEAIEQARIAAAQQAQVLDRQQKQYIIDSVKARTQVINAKAEAEATVANARANAEATKMQGESYQKTPALLKLEVARAMAGICEGVTNCILGGSVMDTWKGLGEK